MDLQTALKTRSQAIAEAEQREAQLRDGATQEAAEQVAVWDKLFEMVKLVKDSAELKHFILSAGGEAVLVRPDFSSQFSSIWITITAYGQLRYYHVNGAGANVFSWMSDMYIIIGEDEAKQERIINQAREMVHTSHLTAALIQAIFEEWMQLVIDFTGNEYAPNLQFRKPYYKMAAEADPKKFGYLLTE